MKSKEKIRQQIWGLLEQKHMVRFPGAKGRIPNFLGAEACARLLSETRFWKRARVLKVNPDAPQRAIRQAALEAGKILYMAVPRLQSEKPFIELDRRALKCSSYTASTIKGAAKYGRPVSLDKVGKIDLIVCGSVAVNRKGARIGKGGGYSDLEFALLTETRKIGRTTPIVTSVHPLQLLDEEIAMSAHDVPLTAIVMPDRVFEVKTPLSRPKGIDWDHLPCEMIESIPVLKGNLDKERGSR